MEPLSANDPRMIGEFRLHAQLGAGGMGQVYLGFSPAGRAVAIKVIHPQYARDQEFLRRFSHEVAAASAVGGMYTAPVVDYDLRDSPPWLATAYVPGPTLDTVVSKHGPLPEAAIWRLAAGLTEALRAVHAKGLVHRDLKPANVLLADNGPHVIDFGISRASSSMTQLTSAGMAIGTPGYMSPEQAQTQVAGPPSDIFSLGCVLAYAATGQPPFAGENPASILFRIVTAEPDLSMIPPGLRQVIDACLQKNPASRPEPGRLIAMFNELGPATPVTLGSFWPEAVARVIAADQASQTPAGLTPPAPFAGTTGPGTGRMPGSASFTASTPGERTPTTLATPPSGPVTSATGHAPMLSDGYYAAAAQGRPASPQAPAGPSAPPMSAPPAPYGTQPPYGVQPPTGQAPAASYPGQGASYPGQGPYSPPVPSYSGQQPGSGDVLSRYAPARRKPTSDEVPSGVHTAIRLMYLGFVVTVLNALLSLPVLGRYNRAAKDAQAAAAKFSLRGTTVRAANQTNIWHHQSQLAGLIVILLVADVLGLACWAWLAVATRRGHGWTRIGGTVLLAVYSIVALFVVFRTENDLDVVFTTLVVWAVGVAAVIPLWSQQATEFFAAWRKH